MSRGYASEAAKEVCHLHSTATINAATLPFLSIFLVLWHARHPQTVHPRRWNLFIPMNHRNHR
jgi:hypothetical protein